MSITRRIIGLVVSIALAVPVLHAQDPVAAANSADLVRAYVERIPVGSRVRVTLDDGTRMRGTLMLVQDGVLVLRERKRHPEPPRQIPLERIADLELQKNGGGIGKAIAIGASVGAGAALAVIAILAAAFTD
jgi:hypothetical protein